MKTGIKVEGFRGLEKALAELPRSTSKGVARRAMRNELKPVAAMANALWPGTTRDVFKITSRLIGRQRGESRALKNKTAINLYIGAPGGADGTPHAHLVEFGTGPRSTKGGAFRGAVAPRPMLQPAWDAHRRGMIPGLGKALWLEIEKSVRRRAKRAAKAA